MSICTCNFYENDTYVFFIINSYKLYSFSHVLRNDRQLLSVDFRKVVRKLEYECCMLSSGVGGVPGRPL